MSSPSKLERINKLSKTAIKLAALLWHQKSFRNFDIIENLLVEAKMGAVKSADMELYDFALECKEYVLTIRDAGSEIQDNITYV